MDEDLTNNPSLNAIALGFFKFGKSTNLLNMIIYNQDEEVLKMYLKILKHA